jgi:phage recombination protein Bet
MKSLATTSANLVQLDDSKRLKLIKDTVAKQCNDVEFNWFISICNHLKLDPLRRQVHCFIFHADKPDKRQMVPVIAIGGFRSIAARTGCYRADNRPARIEADPSQSDPATNPHGLVRAEVSVFQYSHGEWHEIVGEAYWNEAAPIVDEWAEDERSGRRKKTGKRALDSKKEGWVRMPRLMLAKVAEASALRKAWPDDFTNVYEESEIDRHQVIDLMPSEIVEHAEVERKLNTIGGKDALTVDWCDAGALGRIPLAEFFDASLRWMTAKDRTADQIEHWLKRNALVRGEVKAKRGSDYLDWQKAVEQRLSYLRDRDVVQGEGQ